MLAAVSGSLITRGLGLRIIFVGRLVKTAKSTTLLITTTTTEIKEVKETLTISGCFSHGQITKYQALKLVEIHTVHIFLSFAHPLPPFRPKTTKSCLSYS